MSECLHWEETDGREVHDQQYSESNYKRVQEVQRTDQYHECQELGSSVVVLENMALGCGLDYAEGGQQIGRHYYVLDHQMMVVMVI